ncbi:MAG TPA: metalloregulator ArsR/SmtB family transcription factor [Streptosporangiaceae bacterium]|nr:metalloregulator ArsR/SmtB family transcription factor [Streptosporangiaceae bacterium]
METNGLAGGFGGSSPGGGSAALGALGDPTRRAIFECLAREPMAVGQLAELFPVSRPAVSQHLKVLKDAGLVTDAAIGTKRVYRVSSGGLQSIHAYLDQMWGQALAGFQRAAEQLAAKEQEKS